MKKVNHKENEIYLAKIDEIGDEVYEFYRQSNRKDLIMVYKMQENKIYSYLHDDFKKSLNDRSKAILEAQYNEAIASNKIVLFIKDELRKKFKSFVI